MTFAIHRYEKPPVVSDHAALREIKKVHKDQLDVIIIVNGFPVEVRIHRHQNKIAALMRTALVGSGTTDTDSWSLYSPDLLGWYLRDKDGTEIPTSVRVSESGVSEGDTLFLDVAEGAGA